jgi:hypothetical protein
VHPNAIHARLSKELAQTESRVHDRLDAIEARLDVIIGAGGLSAPPKSSRPAEAVEGPRPTINEAR